MNRATSSHAERLRRSLRRLGFDLKEADRRGRFHIVAQGALVEGSEDLFGLDLAGVEAWIRERANARSANGTRH